MLRHERDQLVVADAVAVEQAELGDERLAHAQRVARADAGLREQLADRRLVDALDVVLDALGLDAALASSADRLRHVEHVRFS